MSDVSDGNGLIRHSRTNSSTSSTSTEGGLVLSVASLNNSSNGSKRPNSGNNNTTTTNSSSSSSSTAICSSEISNLRTELDNCKVILKTKDEEINKLNKIRDELESEVQELTASLFEEAHKMVGEANVRAAASERSMEEAAMKIDGLETEVAALKDLVLTSTPSKPNKHLHPQLSDKKANSSKKAANTSMDFGNTPPNNAQALCQEIDPEDLKWVDPVVKKEYMDWIKAPNLDKNLSKFLKRLYLEDIEPCMTFPNESLALKIIQSIESNTLSISPIVLPKNSSGEMPNFCALFNTSLICQYKLVIENCQSEKQEEFEISQLARNRVAASCDCYNYLRYFCNGLVKAHHNAVYWEIIKRRRRIMLAKLGFCPDEEI